MGGLFSCCCPEDEATRLLREEEDREASQAAREQARYAAEQRHATFAPVSYTHLTLPTIYSV